MCFSLEYVLACFQIVLTTFLDESHLFERVMATSHEWLPLHSSPQRAHGRRLVLGGVVGFASETHRTGGGERSGAMRSPRVDLAMLHEVQQREPCNCHLLRAGAGLEAGASPHFW